MTGRDRMVAIAIVGLVLVAAGWLLVVSPERQKAKGLDTQVAAAQSQLSTAEGQLSAARGAESKYAAAYADVVNLGKAVPASQEVSSLIYQLSQATDEHSVQFNSISSAGSTPSASSSSATTATSAGFSAMPFSFIFGGGFFQLEKLFHQLTSFTTHSSGGGLQVSGRLLTIQSVKLAPEPTGHGKVPNLSTSISATAYVLPAGQGLTAGATATSPTGASVPASTSSSSPSAAPAVVKVTP